MNSVCRRILVSLLLIGAGALSPLGSLLACNPEPGPHHFTKISPPPPALTVGYFEVFNTLKGLPCNAIRSILAGGDFTLVGTDGGGLMVYRQGSWVSFT
ncbi:MAG TPA: hypothetical protein PKO06_13515, partial [Candidatus Ozemobacteraceae bacterium]|nr:hypothetical protein [Candidatus Ozemobacteraceae bacterium]